MAPAYIYPFSGVPAYYTKPRPGRSIWRNCIIILSCALVLYLVSRLYSGPRGPRRPPPPPPFFLDELSDAVWRPGVPSGGVPAERPLEDVREIVRKTKGYYVRDWSLYLGWNNMRYIIEAAIAQANLLNRTLVLPSYVYARSCEFDPAICSAYGQRVNRTTWGVTDLLPAGEQVAWRMPICIMFDLAHLRTQHPVILTSEYLALRNLPPSLETLTGGWSADFQPPSELARASAWEYDGDIIRMDRMPPVRPSYVPTSEQTRARLEDVTYEGKLIAYDEARRIVSRGNRLFPDEEVEEALNAYGYEVIYSYTGHRVEHLKFVGEPVRFVAVRSKMRGFVDDYRDSQQKVFWLEGEVHVERRPGDMWFSTAQARDDFSRLVLYTMRRPQSVLLVAERIDRRMRQLVGERMWMAGHMRRGDFVTAWWTHVGTLQEHFGQIKDGVMRGRKVLETIAASAEQRTYAVPDVTPYAGFLDYPPPRRGDPFFLATDERNATELAWLRSQGAVLIDDLLEPRDRQALGWQLMMTDFLGVLEQAVLSRAAFFHGRADSSVSGGALNMRAALGMDPRTAQVEA